MEYNLKDVATKYLVEELVNRQGVIVHEFDPYDEYTVTGIGPATVLEVID